MAAQTVTKLIKVTGVSPYSVYSGTQRYSFNKDVNSTMFVKGNTYSVNVKVGSKGGEYIDSIINNLGAIAGDATPAPASSGSALNPDLNKNAVNDGRPRKTKFGDPLTNYDLDHDARIARSGVIQAAVQAVATHASSVEDLEAKAIKLAEAMLSWVKQSTTTEPVSK